MFNKILAVGCLGKDPVSKQTKSGSQMTSFSIAVDSGFGQNKKTEWFNVSTFGKVSEICQKFLHKGSCVCVSGTLSTHEYESKDGKTKCALEIAADSVNFINKERASQQQSQQNSANQEPETVDVVESDIPF